MAHGDSCNCKLDLNKNKNYMNTECLPLKSKCPPKELNSKFCPLQWKAKLHKINNLITCKHGEFMLIALLHILSTNNVTSISIQIDNQSLQITNVITSMQGTHDPYCSSPLTYNYHPSPYKNSKTCMCSVHAI
jgi:hypothetical protein